MKNSLNNPKRPGMSLITYKELLVVLAIMPTILFIRELSKADFREKQRYAEKRRADL